jgi:hypothetical protein
MNTTIQVDKIRPGKGEKSHYTIVDVTGQSFRCFPKSPNVASRRGQTSTSTTSIRSGPNVR